MPTDCPHDRCDFLLWDPDARCPACGRLPIAIELQQLVRTPWIIVAAGLILGPVLAGVILVVGRYGAAVLLVAAALFISTAVHRVRRRHDSLARTTIDFRYRDAVRRSTASIEKWCELYQLQFEPGPRSEDEASLMREAQSAASVNSAEAIARRNDLAALYVHNSLERVRLATLADFEPAHAITERYLATLWIDPQVAAQARHELIRCRNAHRQHCLVRTVASVRLFDDPPSADPPSAVLGDVAAQRRRLRIERELQTPRF